MARGNPNWVRGGASPNPNGRAVIPPEIKAKFRELTPHAIEVLRQSLSSDDERIRLEAAKEILNRDLGKPHQTIDATVSDTPAVDMVQSKLDEFTEEELATPPIPSPKP